MKDLCLLNDRLLPVDQVRIDPLDRGFLFGDALYEVVKVVDRVPLHVDEHLRRLRDGLERLRIPEPAELARRCLDLVAASGLVTGSLYLQVSRGVAPRSHLPPPGLEPTLLVLPREHAYAEPASRHLRGVTLADPRWRHCDLKTTSMVATVLARLEATGVDEAIFRGERGELREGSHTNLFVRRGDRLETHPLDGRVLPGVTRAQLLGFARRQDMEAVERAPRLAELPAWREALLCGTYTGVQPLVELDGRPVAAGEPGPWTRRLAAALAAYEDERLGTIPAQP